MTSFIQRKEQAGEGDDANTADAYYNRSCYRALRWATAGSAQRQELRAGIESDLRRCRSLDETTWDDVRGDPDFSALKSETWFVALLQL